MFDDSELLQRDRLVFRVIFAPDAYFGVLDETGVEIGRVVEEGTSSQDGQAWLVVYDRRRTRVLAVEKAEYDSERSRTNSETIVDGQNHLVTNTIDWRGWMRDASGQRIGRLKHSVSRRTLLHTTIQDASKTEVGSLDLGRPPAGDQRPGLTFVLTITARITRELRLATLGHVVSLTENFQISRLLKRRPWPAELGLAWPGSENGTESC